jgi:AhpD family alkylhydroperoxidase
MKKPTYIKELVLDNYQIVFDLSVLAASAGISKLQEELIKLRISQINGWASCVKSHYDEALKYENKPERLAMLETWRNVHDWFSWEEQLLLKLTEEITILSEEGLTDETYDHAVSRFGEEMTMKLIIAVIEINALYSVASLQNVGNPFLS